MIFLTYRFFSISNCLYSSMMCEIWLKHLKIFEIYINGLVQDCSNSSALAMELLLPCIKPSTCGRKWRTSCPRTFDHHAHWSGQECGKRQSCWDVALLEIPPWGNPDIKSRFHSTIREMKPFRSALTVATSQSSVTAKMKGQQLKVLDILMAAQSGTVIDGSEFGHESSKYPRAFTWKVEIPHGTRSYILNSII